MSECKEVPWTGTGHAESTREVFPVTVFSQLVFGDLRKKPLSWPGKELCGVRGDPRSPENPAALSQCVSWNVCFPSRLGATASWE